MISKGSFIKSHSTDAFALGTQAGWICLTLSGYSSAKVLDATNIWVFRGVGHKV